MTYSHLQNSEMRSVLSLAAWLAGAAVGIATLVMAYGRDATDFEQVTMGHATTSVYAEIGGERIHCTDDRDIELCLSGAKRRGSVSHVVMLGNSQVHAINQYQRGQQGVAGLLSGPLAQEGHGLLVFSQANANLQEHLVVFAALIGRIKIESLVLPVVFDDMREDGVRESLRIALHAPDTASRIRDTAIGDMMLRVNRPTVAEGETGAIHQTIQEKFENQASQWLEHHAPFWAARKEARGDLMLGLYVLRNAVFGIRPDTARRIIPARYENNRAALRLLLSLARTAGVQVILYIAPIRQDAKLPYIMDQYAMFKQDVQNIANEAGADFYNWESLVPASEWGSKDATTIGGEAEIDYMHFRTEGHARLAAAILGAVTKHQGAHSSQVSLR